MRNTVAIMQRELNSLFFSPIGYVVIALFLILMGGITVWTGNIAPGQPATLANFFQSAPYLLAIIVPAITMRLISEEYRSGTIETLMTAPIADAELVIGKYLAVLAFYAIMLAGTGVYLVFMSMYGNPDVGASFAAYIGLLLAGAAFLAVGLLASSLTKNQIIAWMLGAVPLVLIVWFAQAMAIKAEGTVREVIQRINIQRHLDQFNRGLVTVEGAVFFLGLAGLFVFLSVKVVESKRWR
ncbi:MAG: ABC transporter permease subunit [Phycisphaerales bacterium]|nr:ABC transporter permease subunit [Phycisphaerales bacterium]